MPLPSGMPSPELGAGPLLTANAINAASNAIIVPIILPFCASDFGFCCRFVSHGGGRAPSQRSPCRVCRDSVWGLPGFRFRELESGQKRLRTLLHAVALTAELPDRVCLHGEQSAPDGNSDSWGLLPTVPR